MPTTVRFRRDGIPLHIHPGAGSSETGRWHSVWERHPNDPQAHTREDAEHPFIAQGRYPVAWERRDILRFSGRWTETMEENYFRALRGERFNEYLRPSTLARRHGVAQQEAVIQATSLAVAFSNRKFGVEIECIMNQAEFTTSVRAKGINISYRGYTHEDSDSAWKLVSDGSLRYSGGRRGFVCIELVSPILQGDEGMRQLQLVCESLAETRATVNKTCGLHVHHDAREQLIPEDVRRLCHSYTNARQAIDKLVAPSRRANNNSFCQHFSTSDLATIDAGHTINDMRVPNRYKVINLQAYQRHKSLEFRQHQGTVDFHKISAWVKFGQCMIEAARAGQTVLPTAEPDTLFRSIGMPEDLATYFKSRAEVLAREVNT